MDLSILEFGRLLAPNNEKLFFPCVYEPNPAIPGKMIKRACDKYGQYLKWKKPSVRLTVHEASLQMDHLNLTNKNAANKYGIEYIVTKESGIFVIDLDNCYVSPGVLTPFAQEIVDLFPTALREDSNSGKGIHLYVRGKIPQIHRKNTGTIECYHELRVIAWTGKNVSGSLDNDHTAEAIWLVAKYLQYQPGSSGLTGTGDSWKDYDAHAALPRPPADVYTHIADDEELIAMCQRRMTEADKANKAQANFVDGSYVSKFQLLWAGDWERLGYPSLSHADAALASILAWATGNDAERIAVLMRRSGLAERREEQPWNSEKYDPNHYYLPLTISNACSKTKTFYCSKHVTIAESSNMAGGSQGFPQLGSQLIYQDQEILFKGLVYIADEKRILLPNGQAHKETGFNSLSPYSNYTYAINSDKKTEKKPFTAFTSSGLFKKPQADSRCFRPQEPSLCLINDVKTGLTLYNEYRPIGGARIAGDVSPFLNHIIKMIPDERDREVFICYFASLIQNQGTKFQYALLLQGAQGNGKSFIAECIQYCIGEEYSLSITAQLLNDPFNVWLYKKIFIVVEEAHTVDNRVETADRLKNTISNKRPSINAKGFDVVSRDVCCNFMLNSNNLNAIKVTEDTRRFAVFHTAQQMPSDKFRDGMTSEYWKWLYDWAVNRGGFGIIHEYLATYVVTAEFDPASGINAPDTTSKKEAIEHSRTSVEQRILEEIAVGTLGFRGGWISSAHLGVLLERLHLDEKVSLNARSAILVGLGYVKHPSLSDGRSNDIIKIDNKKSILYVKNGSTDMSIIRPVDVVNAYIKAQET